MSYQKASKSLDRKRCKMCGIWCDDANRLCGICNACVERFYSDHQNCVAAMRNLRRYQEAIDLRIRKGGK